MKPTGELVPHRLEIFISRATLDFMLTDKDVQKMMKVFPTRDDVRLIVQEEIAPMQDTLQRVLLALDRLATAYEKLNIEYVAMSEQLSRHERWIQEIAKKAKVPLSQ